MPPASKAGVTAAFTQATQAAAHGAMHAKYRQRGNSMLLAGAGQGRPQDKGALCSTSIDTPSSRNKVPWDASLPRLSACRTCLSLQDQGSDLRLENACTTWCSCLRLTTNTFPGWANVISMLLAVLLTQQLLQTGCRCLCAVPAAGPAGANISWSWQCRRGAPWMAEHRAWTAGSL